MFYTFSDKLWAIKMLNVPVSKWKKYQVRKIVKFSNF